MCLWGEGAKAMIVLILNVFQNYVIFDGYMGVVKDIVYAPETSATGLYKFVWVDFGSQHRGNPYFPGDTGQRRWVSVHPFSAYLWTPAHNAQCYGYKNQTMIPLKCCWAWKI